MGEQLAVAHDVVAVQRDVPAQRDLAHQPRAGPVLARRALGAERIAAVLELDPDGVQVGVVAGVKRRRGVGHPPRVPGGVLLVHELRDPAVEPDEVVRAHAALRIGEPVARGLEAPDVRVQHDARGRTAAPPALLIRGHPTFCPHREYNVRHQGMDAP